MENILIWGTGYFTKQYKENIETIFSQKKYRLVGFVDNDYSKAGKFLLGQRIYHSTEINNLSYDRIIISASKEKYEVIRKQIIEICNVSPERIHSFTWFITMLYRNKQNEFKNKLNSNKVYDCFPFYNELDILEFRMELLYPYVDFFVLVELEQTHRWETKPLFYNNNRKRFEKYLNKIIYVCPSNYPSKPENTYMDWTLENFQRNSILLGLENKVKDDDIIMVSDVDEIPDPAKIEMVKKKSWLIDKDVYSFKQDFFYYYFDYCHKAKWNGTFITKYKNLGMPQEWRNICGELPEIPNGGWHLSYFGGADRIKMKIRSTVDSAEFTVSTDEIKKRISDGKDIFGRTGTEFDIIKTDFKDIHIENFLSIRDKFPQFFLEEDR